MPANIVPVHPNDPRLIQFFRPAIIARMNRIEQLRKLEVIREKEELMSAYKKAIPEMPYSEVKAANNAVACTCSICFEEFSPETEVRVTSCGHVFHSHCLLEWIGSKLPKPNCPYCRGPFQSALESERADPEKVEEVENQV